MEELNLDLEMSWYNEEMYERRANGIETTTFKKWKAQRAMWQKEFDRHISLEIDLARGK